ncbi:GGDEF domain-containing response regulator [Woodsholea maritima]|uniref:GGDEF domain-containing response regulator n=1 Tax=Woodsholea maritima TaxID=240237 RepID=UPI000369D6A3|nr:diguanylate cyclase [Woodsholea maritima]
MNDTVQASDVGFSSDVIVEAQQMNVLVCEASQVQRSILTRLLTEAGFTVQSIKDADSALSLMETSPPAIFITGVEVGPTSGLEACWTLKASPDTAHVYTIVVSASTDNRIAEALDSGADDFIRKPYEAVEMKARLRAAARMVRLHQHLRDQIEADPLTGAVNRNAFIRSLKMEVAQARQLRLPVSVVMVNFDHFKKINDTHGQEVGDRVMTRAVNTLRNELGAYDVIGRLDGSGFGMIIPRLNQGAIQDLAEDMRRALANLIVEDDLGRPIPLTASFGIAYSPADRERISYDRMMGHGEKALKSAKDTGRNKVVLLPVA